MSAAWEGGKVAAVMRSGNPTPHTSESELKKARAEGAADAKAAKDDLYESLTAATDAKLAASAAELAEARSVTAAVAE